MRPEIVGWRNISILVEFLGEKTAFVYVWIGFAIYVIGESAKALETHFGYIRHFSLPSASFSGQFIPAFVLFGFMSGGTFGLALKLYQSACPDPIQKGRSFHQIEERISQDVVKIRKVASEKMREIATLRTEAFNAKKEFLGQIIESAYGREGIENFFRAMEPFRQVSEEIDLIDQEAEKKIRLLTLDQLDTEGWSFRLAVLGLMGLSALFWIAHVAEIAFWIAKHLVF